MTPSSQELEPPANPVRFNPKSDSGHQALLTGGKPQAQGNMGFARATRPEGDDVLNRTGFAGGSNS